MPFVGELGALEEVVGQLVTRGLLKPMTLKALWFICSTAFDQLTHVSATCMWAAVNMPAHRETSIGKRKRENALMNMKQACITAITSSVC